MGLTHGWIGTLESLEEDTHEGGGKTVVSEDLSEF